MSPCSQDDQAGTANFKWQRKNCLYSWGNVRLSLYKKTHVIWVQISLALLSASIRWVEGLRFDEILTPMCRSTAVTTRGVPFIVYIWFRLFRLT